MSSMWAAGWPALTRSQADPAHPLVLSQASFRPRVASRGGRDLAWYQTLEALLQAHKGQRGRRAGRAASRARPIGTLRARVGCAQLELRCLASCDRGQGRVRARADYCVHCSASAVLGPAGGGVPFAPGAYGGELARRRLSRARWNPRRMGWFAPSERMELWRARQHSGPDAVLGAAPRRRR